MPTNIIESSQELSDKDFFCLIIILLQSLVICNYNLVTSTWMCSIRILSSVGGYSPAPLALLLVFAARRILLPSGQLWFVPSRFQPCLTNLPTVKRPFHVGWFCSRVSVLNSICYRQGVVWFHVSEYYCHRHSSDSCRRDFNLVSLICRLWNALSTSGGSVHVYRFSTIFAIDRVWFGSMSMYSSRKRQLLLCESCFAEALELPLESFLCPDQAVPTLHNSNWREHVSIRRK